MKLQTRAAVNIRYSTYSDTFTIRYSSEYCELCIWPKIEIEIMKEKRTNKETRHDLMNESTKVL